jgi:sulfatase maturation enzyme AslB (radical SAM superfamily)
MKNVRSKMLQNEWPEECIRCQTEEKTGLRSRREYERENWFIDNEYVKENTKEDGTIVIEDFPLQYLDLRFGNNCNLSCRMCGPSDSSSWYEDHVKLTGKTEYWDTHGKVELKKNAAGKFSTTDYDWYNSESFWKEMNEMGSGVRHIYMAGGEPLLIEKHFSFLNDCIGKGFAKNIILEYNTNLSFLNEKIINLWEQFKQVRVGASIDGMGDVLEYQRHPIKWDSTLKNLQILDGLKENIFSWLALTITNYNVFHVPEFIKWKLKESNFKRINSSKKKPIITHHMCHSPLHLNIRSLPPELKELVTNKYKDLIAWGNEQDLTDYQKKALENIVDGVLTYMEAESYKDWDYFIEYTAKLDRIRNQNILNIVPEYAPYFQK